MKKVMYLIGLVSSISICIGWLFKILHWPGADELFLGGFLAFVLIFIPSVVIDRFRVAVNKTLLSEKLKIILGVLSGAATGLAVIFKIMHLPGADQLLIFGFLAFSFGFLPFLFFRMYRKAIEYNRE